MKYRQTNYNKIHDDQLPAYIDLHVDHVMKSKLCTYIIHFILLYLKRYFNYFIFYNHINGPVPVVSRSKAWVCCPSLAGIAGSNPAGGMEVCHLWIFYVVRYRSPCRADHSPRAVLPSVVYLSVVVRRSRHSTGRFTMGKKLYRYILYFISFTYFCLLGLTCNSLEKLPTILFLSLKMAVTSNHVEM